MKGKKGQDEECAKSACLSADLLVISALGGSGNSTGIWNWGLSRRSGPRMASLCGGKALLKEVDADRMHFPVVMEQGKNGYGMRVPLIREF